MRMMFLAAAFAWPSLVPAASYAWSPGVDVVGMDRFVRTSAQDTLLDLARQYGFGYDELRMSNPDVDPWLPGEGTTVVLPSRHVLPEGPREGIVINLEEMRLFYFPPPQSGDEGEGARRRVFTYPISVGKEGLDTPVTLTTVVEKVHNPIWYPPESVRREYAARGEQAPAMVPPGPDNPLGPLAMKLDLPGVLIHGTNKPYGIGMPVTHGCIRMYPEDIEVLMPRVERGTPVRIVRQAWKTGWRNGVFYFETTQPRSGNYEEDLAELRRRISEALEGHDYEVDWPTLEGTLFRPRGVAQPVWRQTLLPG